MKNQSLTSLAQLHRFLEDGIDQFGTGRVLEELSEVFGRQAEFYQKTGGSTGGIAARYRFYQREIEALIEKSEKLCQDAEV